MKTKFYLFTALMLLTVVVSAQTQTKVYEMYLQDWVNNEWVDTMKTTNAYDTNGNLIKATSAVKVEGTNEWRDTIVMNYSLNTDATIKEIVTQTRQNGEWTNVFKTLYTYNEEKKVLSETLQMWLVIAWADIAKTVYTYENGLLTRQVTQISNMQSPELVNSEQITYTYNSDGTEKDNITQTWNEGQWENATRNQNTYDASKQLTMILGERWENEAWVNESRTTNTYNESGSLTQSVEQTYTENAWVNSSNTLHSYNTTGELDNIVFQLWNPTLSRWENLLRYVYKYSPTGINPIELAGLAAFPNPFADRLTIQSSLQGEYGIEIINSMGQVIKSLKTQENLLNLDLKELQRGLYFIKVKMGPNEKSIKVLKAN